ncbi:MAG: heme lyase CcmF/NrfE family subunit, partial [Gemmatimonadetes bacterium]|nr:heme lyase CcmF/NrfE family subunit [Gemmatimonadota bacterium]NIS00962.1 heme lyase CcmF/NrfE family subunit [Gemmatimonadota bacterium]NIT66589.1 heme lyase CcmF/NrfE family subunit [Gemmatimonadota bacterium]NIU53152.1 heme lyase CcmF/NrfE family subunit [Gemmatimonadota bacterium]NIV23117.1 heme lyase CcmF/NrfE family subunit [Gemmatimonadota bacterium]
WSYEVLGWGGYWAWDPVENASFLPWLTATAFLHSIMVQERRQTLKTWNILLVIATFVLTLFGTFLTRSGILESVHAFTEGLIGPFFLGFIALVMIVSLALVAWRSDELRSEPALDSIASRETAFLLNNLLFVAFTFTVLLGTMYPILAEAARGVKVSVGAPYFNQMSVPIAL